METESKTVFEVQVEKMAEEFRAIRANVNERMIAAAILETGDSRGTYIQYLKGQVKKLAAGQRMLDCLKSLIQKQVA